MGIEKLLSILRANGVTKYKTSVLEIDLELLPLAQPKQELGPLPPGVPPEIHNPDLMNADSVLNWSSPPGPTDKPEVPLEGTGEESAKSEVA